MILSLPSLDALDYAVSSLSVTASPQEVRALTRAQYNLHRGLEIVAVTGGFLVPSASGSTPHRVDNARGCNCAAGLSGRVCWHSQALLVIIEARNARPTMRNLIKSRAEAAIEMDALFN